MRIATFSSYDNVISVLQQRQSELVQAQEQMTSGKRVNRPSDDPTAAARAERALIIETRGESAMRAADASANAMTLAESTLGTAVDLTQQAREMLLAAGNASYSESEREALADELEQLRSQLLAAANAGDGADGYLFGGQGAVSSPFSDGVGGVSYSGAGGATNVSADEQMPTTMNGDAVWLSASTGNGVFVTAADAANTGSAWIDSGSVTDAGSLTGDSYELVFSVDGSGNTVYEVIQDGNSVSTGNAFASGAAIEVDGMSFTLSGTPAAGDSFTLEPSTPTLSIFDTLDQAIALLRDDGATAAEVSQGVSGGVRDIDQSLAALQAARSAAGATLNRLDNITARVEDQTLWAQSVRSDAEDLDMVKALSDFQNKQTGYDAALQVYASVQRMSLFDYLS
jgi:flagellar hook-associated protein 3 FlgL